MHYRPLIILAILFFGASRSFVAFSRQQQAFLVNRKKDTVFISAWNMGATTRSDTFPYNRRNREPGYTGIYFTKDTLIYRRPIKYHDTVVQAPQSTIPYIDRPYEFDRYLLKNGKSSARLHLVEEYEYTTIKTKTLTSISHPPKSDPTGCIFCAFAPGYNIYYVLSMRKYHVPKTYDLSEWKLLFRDVPSPASYK